MKTCKLLFILPFFIFSTPSNAQFQLYGMTSTGGPQGWGVVFSITPSGSFNKLFDLVDSNAGNPYGSLLLASDNNFYGTSVSGGYNSSCNVFKCTPSGSMESIINLDTVYGLCVPYGSIIQAKDGDLYGMTLVGGAYKKGVIFKYYLNSAKYSLVATFNDTNGSYPYGDLLQASDGLFYGMTSGTANANVTKWTRPSTLFSCTSTGKITVLAIFDSNTGYCPFGSIIQPSNGYLYGMTNVGGKNGLGTIFKSTTSGLITKLFDFDSIHGAKPTGSLVLANDGSFYGLTSAGGKYNLGVIFRFSELTGIDTLISFNHYNGATPYGSLTQASDSMLYGMTSAGGAYNDGTVFKCSLSGTFNLLQNFNQTNGSTPMYGRLIQAPINLGINGINNASNSISIYPNPSNGLYTINLPKKTVSYFIHVFNMLGQSVYNSELNSGYNKIDLGQEPKGAYMYRVVGKHGELFQSGKLLLE